MLISYIPPEGLLGRMIHTNGFVRIMRSRFGCCRDAETEAYDLDARGVDRYHRRMKTADSYRERLMSGRWFASLSDQTRDWLLARGLVREYVGAQAIFKQGAPPDGIYAVLEGAVLLTSVEWGRELALSRMEPPTWFGELSMFDRLPRSHLAVAEGRTICLHIPDNYVEDEMRRRPEFMRELAESLAHKLRVTLVGLAEVAALPLAVRAARRILAIAEGYGELDEVGQRSVAVRQDQLASMLAVSRQSVNQTLKELEASGGIQLAYGEIRIVDLEKIRLAAQVTTSVIPR